MDSEDGPRRRRPRGEQTRTALVQAALRVIERDGIASATTRRVAEQAGLPLGAVHYWFADKDDLLRAVVDVLLQEVRNDLGTSPDGESAGHRLARIFANYVAMRPGRQLALFEATTHAIRTDGLQPLAIGQYAAYRSAARKGLAPWHVQVDADLPGGTDALAALLVAVVDGLTLANLADPEGSHAGEAFVLFADLLNRAGLN
ncbi:MAG TPA: TetR family transcriptional regulator [Nakamurella sp.]